MYIIVSLVIAIAVWFFVQQEKLNEVNDSSPQHYNGSDSLFLEKEDW